MEKEYTLICKKHIPELSSTVNYWRHNKTYAEILSVSNDDENKCFGVTFKTPPKDSTGVAHILEHSVLCGSKKYPTKEPFVELLKGSLQTFLNAFTFPDKTCYPVASTNLQDFYNLMGVYLDAVFFPLITEKIFQQEGWHFHIENPEQPITYKGVVFNEMKGVYSSPDSILMEQSQQSLFPDITYGLDSGGNPEIIPNLTYSDFIDFHSTYYHPSNARFFFWGNDPEEERLSCLLPILSQFSKKNLQNTIPLQKPINKPKKLTIPYEAGQNLEEEHITLNWLLCPGTDTNEVLLFEILEYILLGLPGSPLRKKLIESGLGEDIAGVGLEKDLQQLFFSVGLRSIKPNTAQKVETLIMDTLKELSISIESSFIEAAMNSIEFALRENNSGRFPRGLSAMLRSLRTWLYDADPLMPLLWEQHLQSIKQRITSGEKIFETMIKTWFLDNNHRSTVLLQPSLTLAKQRNDKEEMQLAELKKNLSSEKLKNLIQETQTLLEIQKKPDTPEALASIPSLTRNDLPLKNPIIPCLIPQKDPYTILTHPLDTVGIIYVDCLFSLDGIPNELFHLIPLFGRSLTELGTQKYSFVDLGILIASKTGGVDAGPFITTIQNTRAPVEKLCLSGKVTTEKLPDLFTLFKEILLETNFDNQNRILQMALEERARLEQVIIPSGHSIVMARIRAQYSLAGSINEKLGGITYLASLTKLIERINTDWLSVLKDFKKIQELIITQQNILINITANEHLLETTSALSKELCSSLPNIAIKPIGRHIDESIPGEILFAPTQVNYVGKGCNIYDLGYQWHGSAYVITRYLRVSWLWNNVRVQGGAYGVFCTLDRMSGTLIQVSYRDPNVEKTLLSFDNTTNFLKEHTLTDRELTLAIVGAIGDLDTYMLPDAKGMASLTRYLTHDQEDMRQKMREEILHTSHKHFIEFAEIMYEVAKSGTVCILGGTEANTYGKQKNWIIQNIK